MLPDLPPANYLRFDPRKQFSLHPSRLGLWRRPDSWRGGALRFRQGTDPTRPRELGNQTIVGK